MLRAINFTLVALVCLSGCVQEKTNYYSPQGDTDCSNRVIKHEYLVKFKDTRSVQKLKLDPKRLAEIRKSKVVAWVEPNYRVRIPVNVQSIVTHTLSNPAAAMIGADYAWQRGYRGQDITVGIVDSGIDMRHPRLQSNLINGWNFVTNNDEVFDETGHGTHIAGIIASDGWEEMNFSGIAPGVKLIAADFMDADQGDEFNAIHAVDYSIRNGANIVNNSWSNFCSFSIRDAFENWQKMNVIFVNAAGNDFLHIDAISIFPSNLNLINSITVGSVENNGDRSDFSNYGRNVLAYAPGRDVYSLATTMVGANVLVSRSGTSMSTAYVSGALALVWSSKPSLTAAEIVRAVKDSPRANNSNAPVIDVRSLIRKLN